LDWLVALSANPSRVYDLRGVEAAMLQALQVPELSDRAILVLAQIGSHEGQRSLVRIANQSTSSPERRRAAAAAFAASVKRHGVLLPQAEIVRQYAIYNDNGGRDSALHEASMLILDAIEARSAGASL
jgi:hypothetical protein